MSTLKNTPAVKEDKDNHYPQAPPARNGNIWQTEDHFIWTNTWMKLPL